MSGTTLVRGFILLNALALSACATTHSTPLTAQSLLDSMAMERASLSSCRAANMALVCESAAAGRTKPATDGRCSCADRNELAMGGR